MKVKSIKTSTLRFAYEESGPSKGEPLLLVHGWPDSPRTWDRVLPALHQEGYKTLVPYLRGFGPTAFRDPLLGRNPRRTGQPVVLAQDIVDFADALGLRRFHFIGHDWGARTGYALAALFPRRIKSLTTLSVVFQPGPAQPPELLQAQAYWYQWLLCTKPGEKKFLRDPIAFCRAQWDAWSPEGWYTEAEFAEAAESWTNDNFVAVTLQSYRSRWGHAPLDPAYAQLQGRFEGTLTIDLPTQLLHGALDRCLLLESSEGAEMYFTSLYRRVVLGASGHFPQREQPEAVAQCILEHVDRFSL